MKFIQVTDVNVAHLACISVLVFAHNITTYSLKIRWCFFQCKKLIKWRYTFSSPQHALLNTCCYWNIKQYALPHLFQNYWLRVSMSKPVIYFSPTKRQLNKNTHTQLKKYMRPFLIYFCICPVRLNIKGTNKDRQRHCGLKIRSTPKSNWY